MELEGEPKSGENRLAGTFFFLLGTSNRHDCTDRHLLRFSQITAMGLTTNPGRILKGSRALTVRRKRRQEEQPLNHEENAIQNLASKTETQMDRRALHSRRDIVVLVSAPSKNNKPECAGEITFTIQSFAVV